MAQYRYSSNKIQRDVVAAAAMTGMVAGLVWMLMTAAARPDANLWAGVAGLVFFLFVSATMLLRYLRKETVLAVRPTGLYDARYGPNIVPWEDIRDIMLKRHENEFELEIYLWHAQRRDAGSARADFVVDLNGLEAGPEPILRDIAQYKPVAAGPELRQLHEGNGVQDGQQKRTFR